MSQDLRELAREAGVNLSQYPENLEYPIINFQKTEHKLKQKKLPHRTLLQKFIDPYRWSPYLSRFFLSGEGRFREKWTKVLSREALEAIAKAGKTKKFCRFEIWQPILDSHFWDTPIIVGFASWEDNWEPIWATDGHVDEFSGAGTWVGGDLTDCRVIYLICEI